MQPILLPPDMPHIEMIDADYEAEKGYRGIAEGGLTEPMMNEHHCEGKIY